MPPDRSYKVIYFDWWTKFIATWQTIVSRADWAQITNILIVYWEITADWLEVLWTLTEDNRFGSYWGIWVSSVVYEDWGTFYVDAWTIYRRDWTQIQTGTTIPPWSVVVSSSMSTTIDGITYWEMWRVSSFSHDDDDNDAYYSNMYFIKTSLP